MKVALILSFLIVLELAATPATAQRLIFQQKDTLYTASESGLEVRPLLTIGTAPDTLWSASPDGRRIAVLMRPPLKAGESSVTGLASRPATVRITDMTGRRQKRLFTTDSMRDRQGRKVTLLGVPLSNDPEGNGTGSMDEWEVLSLSWSTDSRTLYLSCYFIPNPAAKATFPVDAATGVVLVDAEGRWKSIAPVAYPEARGGLLVGAGFAQFTLGQGGSVTYSPLVHINLIEGQRIALYKPDVGLEELPEYAFASFPALAPQNRWIAFVGKNRGLWVTDKFGKVYRRLVQGEVRRPRFSADGKSVLFLLPRALAGDKATLDLYRLPLPSMEEGDAPLAPTAPTLILQDVTWFDLVSD